MIDCPKFCELCPNVPNGIIAEATQVRIVAADPMMRSLFGDQADRAAKGMAEVDVHVVSSENPDADVGSTTTYGVKREGRNRQQISEAIRNCAGPKRTLIVRLLGLEATCGAVRPLL